MSKCLELFFKESEKISSPHVLELGTRRSKPNRSTLHKNWVPHASRYVGTDFVDGDDVDVVADIHTLSKTLGENAFDIIISCSTFEHVQYPWLAAEEISRTLTVGGLIAIQTHHAFPLHAYPNDYWRFSTEALETLFCENLGFEIIGASYDFKSHIFSWRLPWLARHKCFLNSYIVAKKVKDISLDFSWRNCKSL
ncbi:MAG: methyltransferase domain-containing protein [Candidatus Thiodiazotropha sp. L084R]